MDERVATAAVDERQIDKLSFLGALTMTTPSTAGVSVA